MDLATLCTFVVSLRVFPNRLQFFQYDSVSLSCEDQTNASEWTIMRNTSFHKNEKNSPQNKSNWVFNSNLYYNDAGVYWCQSERGECGAVVNINVTAGHVILESPSLPVKEGETVTLRCLFNPRKKTRTEGTFVFFKDGDCVRNSTGGDLTIHNVAHSDSGLYTCSHQGELSLGSTLEVLKTAGRPPQPELTPSSVTSSIIIALPVAVVTLGLLCTALVFVFLWRKRKGRENHDALYANAVIIQTPGPRRLKDLKSGDDSAFYSTLQLNFM
ncbi:hypothetical protein NQD34_013390 [Periophthalmus magnuspinnatus]|uniref:low affinity immunoglobulin gamma Fc region receptor II-a-like n=1 Tax=Periophthalmus magnuspinnatus TaxID=409849 RepID=UPI00145BE2D8|nr:low affinity immunoglobulin gamma Fc region receptor II-a-like [Periophthalmus magnuspinnatus]KAJ0006117.1 hypothetical protein NQD34_013390 [Periophthalmus magnuspinnatus]